MNAPRAPLLILLGAYLLAQAALVVHPYGHDSQSGLAIECAVCDAIASTKGSGQLAAAEAAIHSPPELPVARLVSQSSRIVPSAYAPRAPPSA
ncbi:MAG: hypothetical protein R3286_09200 [Gammaproteobacteria bacterium]|nr:hypothetical protein [Gammaproteobacteria bacterium]